jgi:DNA-binding NtrC family response regulator
MAAQTVLIAETDHHSLDILPRILSDHIPDAAIEICTSADELARKLDRSRYDTVATGSALIHHYLAFKHKRPPQLLAPCIVTAGQEDRTWAATVLEGDAFDLIAKPIVADQAVQTVRLALWHHAFLRLLASRERAVTRFQQHMAAFPHAQKAEAEFISKLTAYERTFQALTASMRLLLNIEDERSLFDMAASVESFTRKLALKRLFNMCPEGPTQ